MCKMFVRIISLLFVGLLLFSSCKSKKKIVSTGKKTKTERVIISRQKESKTATLPVKKEASANASYNEIVSIYIENYSIIAKDEMQLYGIPASITLAQGILESGAGRSGLSRKSNNHFGIKCHKDWTGERVYHDDDELQECFRKYKDPDKSFRDHSLFLTERTRYKDLFKLKKDDYKGWAKGLRKAGYATDPKYPKKLIDIIERYKLFKLDAEVLGKKGKKSKKGKFKISTYTVQKGDTLYSISQRFNMTVENLKELNGLDSNIIDIGQILNLNSKKNK